MSFAQSVEISIDFGVELLEIGLAVGDLNFEVAGDLFFLVLATDEDDVLGNHGDLLAVLSFEINFKLPIVQSHIFVCIDTEVHALSV